MGHNYEYWYKSLPNYTEKGYSVYRCSNFNLKDGYYKACGLVYDAGIATKKIIKKYQCKWYYLKSSGAMVTDWIQVGGTWDNG